MELISTILRWIFTYLLYPAIIIGIFWFIVIEIADIILKTHSSRAATAAVLPVAGLVFLIVTETKPEESMANILVGFPGGMKFMLGAAIGAALLEIGRYLLSSDSAVGPPVYVLFLSMTGVFILYAVMSKLLVSIHILLFGFVIGGGLQIIFRGPPTFLSYSQPRKANESTSAEAAKPTTKRSNFF